MNVLHKLCLLCLLASWAYPSRGQEKNLTIDRLVSDRQLSPQTLSQLQWLDNELSVIYIEDKRLLKVDVLSGKETPILSQSQLNAELERLELSPMKKIPLFKVYDNTIYLVHDLCLLKYNTQSQRLEKESSLPEDANHLDFNYLHKKIACTQGNSLMLIDHNIKIRVSTTRDEGIRDGVIVHRNEFGVNKGTFFSPNGDFLAYYNLDERQVSNYPLVNINHRVARLENNRYPMAGMASQQVRVGIYDVKNFDVVFVKTGFDREAYCTSVTWAPDSKSIFIGVLSRDQKEFHLNQYDALNGRLIREILEENSERYVEPLHPLHFLPQNEQQFLWLSQRDGFHHIYLYNTEGKLIRQLTQGPWVVKSIVGFSEKGDKVFFTANLDSPLETHLYAVPIRGGKPEKLTDVAGTHQVTKHPNKGFFIDQYSNQETPNCIRIIDEKGKTIRTLLNASNPLEEYAIGSTEIVSLKADDGSTDLYGRLIKPKDFDPQKKYPVVVYVYGGPHSQLITNSWLNGGNLFFHYLAQEGFLVWTVDGRGTANRGFEFESCIHRNLGTIEVADQIQGIQYLKQLPYVDTQRIGVDGWSYGGFMAISLKLKHPNVFKVATAGGPVIDWQWYEIMYGERYMDSPQSNPEGYKKASLLNYIDQLEGKLLVIHGAMDDVVVWQHSLAFIEECIQQQKQVDYFVYPSFPHNVRGAHRAHLYHKLFDYYRENL